MFNKPKSSFNNVKNKIIFSQLDNIRLILALMLFALLPQVVLPVTPPFTPLILPISVFFASFVLGEKLNILIVFIISLITEITISAPFGLTLLMNILIYYFGLKAHNNKNNFIEYIMFAIGFLISYLASYIVYYLITKAQIDQFIVSYISTVITYPFFTFIFKKIAFSDKNLNKV